MGIIKFIKRIIFKIRLKFAGEKGAKAGGELKKDMIISNKYYNMINKAFRKLKKVSNSKGDKYITYK